MKITKLLRVVLVSEKYIVVNDGSGNNRTITVSDSSGYEIGDMYTLSEEPPIVLNEKKNDAIADKDKEELLSSEQEDEFDDEFNEDEDDLG